MVRVNAVQKIFLFVPIVLGIISGILGSYLLAVISVICLFIIIGLTQPLKHHRFIFLFFFMFLTSLPINIRASRDLSIMLNDREGYVLTTFCILIPFILFGIEVILSGIISYLLWGEQDDISAAEKEKQAEEGFEIGYKIECIDKICADIQREIDNLDQEENNDVP